MRVDIFSILLRALSYQGVLIEGWVSIVVAYILLGRNRSLAGLVAERPMAALNIPALMAWLGATIIGIAMLNAGPSVSVFSAPVTALSAASFYVMSLLLPSASRARAQPQN